MKDMKDQHLGMSGHVVGALTGVLEGNLLGHEPEKSFCANVAENKVCAVVGTTATARQTWEPAVCEVQCSSGNTHWREDKFHTLHNFSPPPHAEEYQSQDAKKKSLSLKSSPI